MVRSELSDQFGQIALAFVISGIMSGLLFHWLAFFASIGCIFLMLWIFNSIEQERNKVFYKRYNKFK